MNELEFKMKIEAITEGRLNNEYSLLQTGKLIRELCNEYLEANDNLPEGFERFADK